jgi:hypothetical protein
MEQTNKRPLYRLATLLVVLGLCARGFAMTVDDLTQRLQAVGAGEVALLKANPAKIEEAQPDFLRGASFLRVTVLTPHRPHLLYYVVAPSGGIYRLKLGHSEVARMQTDLDLRIIDEDTALRYAQWLLETSQGPSFQPVSTVDDVPFMPAADREVELRSRIDAAKQSLRSRISPPAVKTVTDGFVVTQFAVKDRDLVRCQVTVTHLGRADIKMEAVEQQIPVVYVFPG